MIRVPGILAGLKERSQSAYAMPAPKPVPSATGHARPARERVELEPGCWQERVHVNTYDGRG